MIGIRSSFIPASESFDPSDASTAILDLTALLDVLFILLVFFILTSGITQFYTQVQLPRSEDRLETKADTATAIVVEMLALKKSWKVNGNLINDEDLLKQTLLNLNRTNVERFGKDSNFILAPDRNLPSEQLIQMLNFLSANKISNVQIISQWN